MSTKRSDKPESKSQFTILLGILLVSILSLSAYPTIQVCMQPEFELALNIPISENDETTSCNEILEESIALFSIELQKIAATKATTSLIRAANHFSISPISFEIHLPPPKTHCFLV